MNLLVYIKENNSQLDEGEKMLGKFKKGESCTIVSILKVDALVRRRLLDLGITEGSVVTIRGIMPFGGPYMIESEGQYIGIRKKEANRIEVEEYNGDSFIRKSQYRENITV